MLRKDFEDHRRVSRLIKREGFLASAEFFRLTGFGNNYQIAPC